MIKIWYLVKNLFCLPNHLPNPRQNLRHELSRTYPCSSLLSKKRCTHLRMLTICLCGLNPQCQIYKNLIRLRPESIIYRWKLLKSNKTSKNQSPVLMYWQIRNYRSDSSHRSKAAILASPARTSRFRAFKKLKFKK